MTASKDWADWFRKAVGEEERPPPRPEFDVGAAADASDQLVELIVGMKNRVLAAGFSETAAEQVAVAFARSLFAASAAEALGGAT